MLVGCSLLWAAVVLGDTPSVRTVDPGPPWPVYDLLDLAPPAGSGVRRATALAVLDLDGDGNDDLAVAWAVEGGTVVGVYPGIGRNRPLRPLVNPFREARVLAKVHGPVDRLAAADVDGDGHPDLAMAALGTPEILWIPSGSALADVPVRRLRFHGTVTALAGVDFGRRDRVPDLVVGLERGGRAWVEVRTRRWDALGTEVEQFAIPAPAASIDGCDLDGDGFRDLVLGTERGVVTVHGVDTALHAERAVSKPLELLATPDPVLAVTTGRVHRKRLREVVALTAGGVRGFDPGTGRWWNPLEPAPARPEGTPVLGLVSSGVGRGPAVVTATASGIELFAALSGATAEDAGWRAAWRTAIDLGGAPVAVWSGRLDVDAVDDLVVLVAGRAEPVVILPGPRTMYMITTTDDHDDGSCSASDCTFREAIDAANASPGYDLVKVGDIGSNVVFQPTTRLPDILDSTAVQAYSGDQMVQLNGEHCPTGGSGLVFAADSSSVWRLMVEGWTTMSGGAHGHGIMVYKAWNTSLIHLALNYNAGHGIWFCDASEGEVASFGSMGNGGDGILISQCSDGTSADISVSEFNIGDCGGVGVDVASVPDVTVEQDRLTYWGVHGNAAGVRVTGSGSSGFLLAAAVIVSNNWQGIEIDGAPAVTIGGDPSEYAIKTTGQIEVRNSSGHVLQGIDTGPDINNLKSAPARARTAGIELEGCSNVQIGPMVLARGVSGDGIVLAGGTTDVTIESSIIGNVPDLAGIHPNTGWGIRISDSSGITVGGETTVNQIGGNNTGGILIERSSGIEVLGNLIGEIGTMDANSGPGILVDDGRMIQIHNNSIQGNDGAGVAIVGSNASLVSVRDNVIRENDGLGIDLGNDGVTPPDPDDADTGPNGLLNQPVLAWAETCGGSTYIQGVLTTTPGRYDVDLFTNTVCDASGSGEGESFLETLDVTVPDDGRGHFGTVVDQSMLGTIITATNNQPFSLLPAYASTSEFSPCLTVTEGRPGDADCDCTFAADDLALLIRAETDHGYTPPCNPDANGSGELTREDIAFLVMRIFY